MIDPKDYKRAIQGFRANPHWREYYDGAPTERLQEWIGYHFCYSSGVKPTEEVIDNMKRLENEFTIEEWEYVYAWAGHNQYRYNIRKRIEALKEKE